jgi:hypothetical protein
MNAVFHTAPPARLLQQFIGLALLPIGQASRDFDDTFLLSALDHRDNAQIFPHA